MSFKRGLLVGAGLVGVGVAGAAYLTKVLFQKDIARYNRLAEMSGDKPLLADQIDKLKQLVGVGVGNGSH